MGCPPVESIHRAVCNLSVKREWPISPHTEQCWTCTQWTSGQRPGRTKGWSSESRWRHSSCRNGQQRALWPRSPAALRNKHRSHSMVRRAPDRMPASDRHLQPWGHVEERCRYSEWVRTLLVKRVGGNVARPASGWERCLSHDSYHTTSGQCHRCSLAKKQPESFTYQAYDTGSCGRGVGRVGLGLRLGS